MPAETDDEDLVIPALSLLASAPDGRMLLPEFIAMLETRKGPTLEAAADARSVESRTFEQTIRDMISDDPGSHSLVDRGFVATDSTGTSVQITPAGRDHIGRR